jgi:hypothetical protein
MLATFSWFLQTFPSILEPCEVSLTSLVDTVNNSLYWLCSSSIWTSALPQGTRNKAWLGDKLFCFVGHDYALASLQVINWVVQ